MSYNPPLDTLASQLNGATPSGAIGASGEWVLDPPTGYLWGPKSNVWPATPNTIFSLGSNTIVDGGSATSPFINTLDGGAAS